MPAANRPRRSTRTSNSSNDKHDDDKEIIDTDEESFKDDDSYTQSKSLKNLKKIKSIKRRRDIDQEEPQDQEEPSQSETTEKPIIPKRKRDDPSTSVDATLESLSVPPEEIKRKKKEPSNNNVVVSESSTPRTVEKRPTSSLIANMAPVDTKKLQPSIKDWKSKEDYQQYVSRNRESRPFVSKSVGGNVINVSQPASTSKLDVPLPYNAQQQQQQQQQQQLLDPTLVPPVDPIPDKKRVDASNNVSVKDFELINKILHNLNQVLLKVMESQGKKRTLGLDENSNNNMTTMDLLNELVDDYKSSSKDKTTKNSSNAVIDWYGSFLPTDNEEKFDFGDMDENPPVPMLPDDFTSSECQQWPLSWWGIIPPSDELLDYHDGGSRSRSKSSRERRNGSRERRNGSRERKRSSSRERTTTSSISRDKNEKGRSSTERRSSHDIRDKGRTSREGGSREKSDRDRASKDRSSREKSDKYRESRERSSREKSDKYREGTRERSNREKSDRDRQSREGSSREDSERRRKRDESSSRGKDSRQVEHSRKDRESREREFSRDRQDGEFTRDRNNRDSRGEFPGDRYGRDREFFDDRQARDREFFGDAQVRDRDFYREPQGREREFFRDGHQDWRKDGPPFQGDGWRNMNDRDRGPPPYPENHYGPTQPRDTFWEDPRMYGDRGGRGGGGRGRGNGWDGPGPGRPYGAHGPRSGQYPQHPRR